MEDELFDVPPPEEGIERRVVEVDWMYGNGYVFSGVAYCPFCGTLYHVDVDMSKPRVYIGRTSPACPHLLDVSLAKGADNPVLIFDR